MRLIFMGTPDFAVETLKALIAADHRIAAVYSQPPRPAGRGMSERASPVQTFALAQGIEVRTPLSLKNSEEQARFATLDTDARTRMRRENAMERFRSEVGEVVEADLEQASVSVEEEQLARLLSCISKLPDKMRRIIQGGLEGQKAQALAEAMESSIAVIYVTNHRAHKLLRECMARKGV